MSNNEPIIKIRDRGISIGVFEFVNQDGTKNISCDIQRSFKKKDAQDWTRENIRCYEDDLLKIANICTRAYNAIMSHRAKNVTTQAPVQAQEPVAPKSPDMPDQGFDDEIPF